MSKRSHPKENIVSDRKRVLILCTGNSARSQMAEGLLRHDAGDRFEVASAGVEPTQVKALAIEAMNEIGIDISDHRSKSVDEFQGHNFDYVITVCDNANQQCPMFSGTSRRIHWSIEDPAAVAGSEAEQLTVFQRVRDELRDKLQEFAAQVAE
jgi:arsenate reductase